MFFVPYSVAVACLGYHGKWKVERESTLSLEFSLPLLETMSIVNMLPQQENNFSLQAGKMRWRCAARGVSVCAAGFCSPI